MSIQVFFCYLTTYIRKKTPTCSSLEGLCLFFHKLRKGTQILYTYRRPLLVPTIWRKKLKCIGTQGALLFFHKLRNKHNVSTRAGWLVLNPSIYTLVRPVWTSTSTSTFTSLSEPYKWLYLTQEIYFLCVHCELQISLYNNE
jgi:hypothetical protein